MDAEVDFGDISLSLLHSFPDFSLGLENLNVKGKDEFKDIELAKIKDFDVTLDFWSVVKSELPIQIKGIALDQPQINIQVLNNGKANYDIVKDTGETTTTEESSSGDFLVNLDHYEISNASFIYNDKSAGMYIDAQGINHTGDGDLTASVYDLNTKTSFDKFTVSTGGITYLKKAKATLDAILNIDMNTSTYTLKENDLRINALQLAANGFVQMQDDDIKMDLKFAAPNNDFKDFLSMIPGAYIEGYEDVKANGKVKFDGFVKGTYNSVKEQLPAFKIDFDVANAAVQYPDLPLGIDGINTSASINSPSSNLDKMTIDIPNFKLKLGANPFEGSLNLRTPISDPDIDTKVKGILNLEDLAKAFPMEGVETLNGLIDADFMMKARLSQLDKADYENVNMAGDLRISNINYTSIDMPPIKINQLGMNFTPQFVNIKGFDGLLGKSDIKASGKIDNILAYFSPNKTMKGTVKMSSDLFDANEWLSEETETTDAPVANSEAEEELFDRFDFTMDAKIDKLLYDTYELKNNVAVGHVTPNKLVIDQFATLIGKSDLQGKGTITGVFDYLFDNGILGGEIDLTSNYFDLNQFMLPEDDGQAKAVKISNTEEELEPLLIPENIDMTIHSNFKELIYTNMDLKNVKGDVLVKNKEARIEKGTANTLGGKFDIEGGYNTQDTEKPLFDMSYKLNNLNFQKAFQTFNTFQVLAPIGKFIEGNFNSTLSMKGVLGKDMMPDLNTLTADGFMQTLDAVINNFKPLENLGNQLNVNAFKSMNLKNTKNWFEIADGKVLIREFPYKTNGIDMLIKGQHGINLDMAYDIKAKIPRSLLEKGNIGAAANKGLNFLNKEASKLGVNLDVGKFINVLINMSGTITNPKIKIKPLGADGAETSVKDIVNTVKETVVDTLTKIKDEKIEAVKEDFTARKKELTDEMNTKIDKIMGDAQKQADNAKKSAVKIADQARDRAYAEADKQVEKVKNPLQKIAAKEAAKLAKKQADKAHTKAIQEADKKHASVLQKAKERADKTRKDYQAKIDKLGS